MSDVLDQLREAETASDQLKILQLAWGSGGAGGMVELSLDEAQAILDKLATGKSKAQQIELINRARAERAVVSAFDVALSALIAPMHLVRHIEKVIVTAVTRTDSSLVAAGLELTRAPFVSRGPRA